VYGVMFKKKKNECSLVQLLLLAVPVLKNLRAFPPLLLEEVVTPTPTPKHTYGGAAGDTNHDTAKFRGG
jgi:hypothetical protein